MSTVLEPAVVVDEALPPLVAGERLDQPTFHRRYEAMPPHVKAELIGGVVYMAAAMRAPHSRHHAKFMQWLCSYEDATPGVEAYDNATSILGPKSEPQPDGMLIFSPGKGGMMQLDADGYLVGTPEFIGEISDSTESYDLHAKKADYERAGVREYVVVALRQSKVFWFVLSEAGKLVEQPPDAGGLYRSRVFPGLWLDPRALLDLNGRRLLTILRQGLSTPEHAAFAKELAN